LRGVRAPARRRLLPLHALPASHGDGSVAAGKGRAGLPPRYAGRGRDPRLRPRTRLREALLLPLRLCALESGPARPRRPQRPPRGVRRRPRRPPVPSPVRGVRRSVGAVARRRPAALPGAAAAGRRMRIVLTRAAAQAQPLADRLQALGYEIVLCPLLEIQPLGDEPIDVAGYDWVVVTSPNGAAELARRRRGKPRHLAAVGPGTAEALHARGLQPDVVAED